MNAQNVGRSRIQDVEEEKKKILKDIHMSSKQKEDDSGDGEGLMSGWLPLESNPSLLNDFNKQMGVGEGFAWGDVYGLDDEMLGWVPQPVLAIVLLFPTTKNSTAFKKEQREKIEKDGQTLSSKLFYLTQLDGFGNACGELLS